MRKNWPYPPTASGSYSREASRRNTGGFHNFKTSLQVKLFGFLFCLISNTAVLELHSVGFCQVKVYFKVCFEVQKKSVAIFLSCQSLLLGTNVPNDIKK